MNYKILSLKERIKAISNHELNFNESAYIHWRNDISIVNENTIKKMMNFKKIDPIIFSNAVSYDGEFKKDYESVLENNIYENWFNTVFSDSKASPEILDGLISEKYAGFQFLLYPFVIYFMNKLESVIDSIYKDSELKIDKEKIMDYILTHYYFNLCNIIVRTAIKEVDSVPNDADNKYEYFFDKCKNDKKFLENIYINYPVIVVDFYYITENTLAFLKEILFNIKADYKELKDLFNINGDLQGIYLGEGDSHLGGKTVTVLKFGENKILYKPKTLNIAKSFNNFVSWFNKKTKGLNIKVPNIIIKSEYAYEEFISFSPCKNEKEVKNFYLRMGSILAISYLLNGTDFHMENLVASGEYPVLVDIETLLGKPYYFSLNDLENEFTVFNFEKLERTLFMPGVYISGEIGEEGNDFSALGGGIKKNSYKIESPTGFNSNEFRIEKIDYFLPDSNNLPFFQNGEKVLAENYINEIKEGFYSAYNVFLDNLQEIKEGNLPERLFADNLVRVIFRNTNNYAMILKYARHPDMLSEYLDREKILENMWGMENLPPEIIEAEINDLMKGDVPYFSIDVSTGDIYNSIYKKVLKAEGPTPLDYLKLTIENISEEKRDKLIDVIEYGIGNYHERKILKLKKEYFYDETLNDNLKDKIYKILKEDVCSIEKESYSFLNNKTWNMLIENSDGSNKIVPCDHSLYSGKVGILYYLYIYNKFIEKNIEKKDFYKYEIVKIFKETKDNIDEFIKSGFGLGSNISPVFVMQEILKFEHDDELIFEVNLFYERVINILTKELENESKINVDYLNGVSGYLNHLLRNSFEYKDFEYLLRLFSAHLEKDDILNQAGLAHGISGIALLYARYYSYSKEKKYFDKAIDLFKKEFIAYKDGLKNIWCRGYVGMIMARLLAVQSSDEFIKELDDEIKYYIDKMNETDFQKNDCYCHGFASIVDMYDLAYEIYNDKYYKERSMKILNVIINNRIKNNKFSLETENHYMDFSLFTGLSGVDFTISRYISPEIKGLSFLL